MYLQDSGIPLLERLIRTHPVWYLPGVGRAAVTHLLHEQPIGVSQRVCVCVCVCVCVKVCARVWYLRGWGGQR